MPFIMISAGPTSSRIRTVSLLVVVTASGLAILVLLTAGAALGRWLSSVAPVHTTLQEKPNSAMPFAVEQLGALSGRLFKLESQAGQLSERIGAMQSVATKPAAATRATKKAESGGPLLPPRAESALAALGDLDALQTRLAQVERQIGLVADAASLQNLALMRLPTRLPIENAELGSPFGNREDPFTGRQAFHSGLDFAAGPGTVIHAAAGGTVAFAGFKSDYGWVVEIEHGNGLVTRYAHASRLTVKTGAVVMPGDAIAAVGSTGRSTGPHLHFEVLRDGEAIDPRRYLVGL
jgi:murein DD-endopeptidase MepM/ murein hydrolase activator NlpD